MLKLSMFIREERQDNYWINLTANCTCVCAGASAHSTTFKTVRVEVGFFFWYGSLPKPLAAAPYSESAVKWLVFYWWAPEVASVGNWIFDLLEFGKYILSVWSSPGRTPPILPNITTTHKHTRADRRVVWKGYSSPSPKHIFVLDVFTESLHGDYRCSLTKLGICFKL